MHATALEPANAHPLSHFEAAYLWAHANNTADHLVTGDKRVVADTPFVIDHRLVGMADAAILHGDFYLIASQWAGIIAIAFQWSACCRCGPAGECREFSAVTHGIPPDQEAAREARRRQASVAGRLALSRLAMGGADAWGRGLQPRCLHRYRPGLSLFGREKSRHLEPVVNDEKPEP